MMFEQLVGRKFRHKKRGSEYVVLTEVFNHLEDFEDGQTAYLWVVHDFERYFHISSKEPEVDDRVVIEMRLPLTMQVSGEHLMCSEIVIYQCLSDHRIWGRFKSEFLDGRFEEIE